MDLQLARVEALAVDVGVHIEVTDAAKVFLAEEGYDPVFGARPLKRAIQRSIQDPLALFLLDEEVAQGSVIRIDLSADGDGLEFEPVAPPTPAEASAEALPAS